MLNIIKIAKTAKKKKNLVKDICLSKEKKKKKGGNTVVMDTKMYQKITFV